MAYKTFIFLVVNFAYFVQASETNDLCPCEPTDLKQDSALWKFFQKLATEVPSDDKEDFYAVLPGELSPLVDCGCEEFNRKKRKAVEAAVTSKAVEAEDSPSEVEDDENVRSKKSLRSRGRCPQGMVKLFGVCVEEDALDSK